MLTEQTREPDILELELNDETSAESAVPDKQETSQHKLTKRNKENIVWMIAGLILMRFFDVSQGDWDRIQPAAESLLEFILPVLGLGSAFGVQQWMKKND